MVLVIVSTFSIVLTVLPETVRGNILYVGGTGPGNYTTIQEAIIAANPGYTVYVYNGTYYEHITIDKPLTMVGEDRDTTIIDGNWLGPDIVLITADWVNVTGFTMFQGGAGVGDAGIELAGVENCHISDNIISIGYFGIRVLGGTNNNISGNHISLIWASGVLVSSSNNLTVEGNNITEDDTGIRILNSENITVTGNELSLNDVYSIYARDSRFSEIVANNFYIGSDGVHLYDTEQITIAKNSFASIYGFGVNFWHSSNNTIIDNDFNRNDWVGIRLRDSMLNTIVNNTFTDNVEGGISLYQSTRNIITRNLMFGNGIDIAGGLLQHWNTHMIDTLNTVNGKPIYYWKNVTGGSIPLDAGEAILANCTGVTVQNLDVSNGTVGVETGFSSRNTIVNNTASINDIAGILLDHSNETTIYNNTAQSNKYGVYVSLSENISINRNNASNNRLGIFLYDQSNNNTLTENNVSFNSDSGVYVGDTDNNTVRDNVAIGNGLDAVYVGSSTNIVVINNTMVENGVYVRGELLEHWNTHVIDTSNSINGKPVVYWKNSIGVTVPPGAGQIILANCVNIVVDSQNVSDGTAGIEAGHSQWITITNNTAVSNNREGIFLSHTSNVTIAQNNASHNMHGLYTYYESYYLNVIDNILSNNSGVGLRSGYFWSGKTYYSVFENNVLSSNAEEGMHVQGDFNDIVNNTATDNLYGIYLQRSTGLNVTWNNISGNEFGINFRGDIFDGYVAHNSLYDNNLSFRVAYSDLNVIANNTVNRSWDDGFYLYGSDSNTIINNIVVDSAGYGIEVDYSDFNMIYHNDFVFNALQVYDETGTNIWDNGYPSGGNFWSDYNGTDNKSGPNQDQPGSDGIGDTPYLFDFSQDNYPLMNASALSNLKAPSAPLNLTAGAGDGQANLSWDSPLDDGGLNVRKYRIYRGNTSGGEAFLIEIGNVNTYTDTGLTNGQTYFYQVSAVNAAGEGPLSNEANATPKGPPGSPGMIGVNLTGLWFEDVTVTWALSSDDGTGQNSVVSYEIYKNMNFDPDGLGYGLLASVPNGTTSYTDMWAGEPDMNSYFYRICALDKFGVESCSGTQASKFTRYIVRGMNLVSFPLIPADDDSATILQTVYHDESWIYDSLSKTWQSSVAMKPYSQSPGPVNNTMAMWISVTFGSNFTVTGVVPDQSVIQLRAGWNLVGFPSFNSTYTVSDLKLETGATRVEGFDPSSSPYFLKGLQDSDVLMAGQGYWIYVPSQTIWVVNNS
jgi:parallel beta-helix repeat protein